MRAPARPSVRSTARPDRPHRRTRPTALLAKSRIPVARKYLPADTAAGNRKIYWSRCRPAAPARPGPFRSLPPAWPPLPSGDFLQHLRISRRHISCAHAECARSAREGIRSANSRPGRSACAPVPRRSPAASAADRRSSAADPRAVRSTTSGSAPAALASADFPRADHRHAWSAAPRARIFPAPEFRVLQRVEIALARAVSRGRVPVAEHTTWPSVINCLPVSWKKKSSRRAYLFRRAIASVVAHLVIFSVLFFSSLIFSSLLRAARS